MKINNPLKTIRLKITNLSSLFILIPAFLLLSALFIRIFAGSSILIYGATGGKGLFPGPFVYTVGYIIRIVMSGIVTAALITSYSLYENRIKLIILSVISALFVLLEYKLIFISVKLLTAFLVSACAAVLWLLISLNCKKQDKTLFLISLTAAILELLFAFQILTLIFSV